MPDTAQHRADMFRLAQERRDQGKPVWETTIDVRGVFHNDDMPVEEKAKIIADRVRNCRLADDELRDLADELSEQTSTDDFDSVWGAIYDWADYNRVWIKTV